MPTRRQQIMEIREIAKDILQQGDLMEIDHAHVESLNRRLLHICHQKLGIPKTTDVRSRISTDRAGVVLWYMSVESFDSQFRAVEGSRELSWNMEIRAEDLACLEFHDLADEVARSWGYDPGGC